MSQKPYTLIIGAGEVGSSLRRVLEPYYNVEVVDKEPIDIAEHPEIMHICFGYSDNFVEEVRGYQEKYKPQYTVIHSSVPIGTSRKCGSIFSRSTDRHRAMYNRILWLIFFLIPSNFFYKIITVPEADVHYLRMFCYIYWFFIHYLDIIIRL